MKNFVQICGPVALALFVFGCQTVPYQPYARDVKKKPGKEGVIALRQENRPEDRALADKMMAQNCTGKEVKVLEEGEVVIGEKTKSSGNESHVAGQRGQPVGTLFGLPITSGGRNSGTESSSESEKLQLKEWQISYECELGKNTVKR